MIFQLQVQLNSPYIYLIVACEKCHLSSKSLPVQSPVSIPPCKVLKQLSDVTCQLHPFDICNSFRDWLGTTVFNITPVQPFATCTLCRVSPRSGVGAHPHKLLSQETWSMPFLFLAASVPFQSILSPMVVLRHFLAQSMLTMPARRA